MKCFYLSVYFLGKSLPSTRVGLKDAVQRPQMCFAFLFLLLFFLMHMQMSSVELPLQRVEREVVSHS